MGGPETGGPGTGIYRSIPRRIPLAPRRARRPIPPREPPGAPPVRPVMLAGRLIRWFAVAIRSGLRLLSDRRAGPLTPERIGVRMRQAFEQVGGPAVKIGQQLAIRVDMLPFALCQELSRLTDRVAPFPFPQAIPRIERAIGGPIGSVFAAIDPAPIGAASMACVYKGVLLTGEAVAIKVQRPAVAEQFACDILAFEWITLALEGLTFVRPGFFRFVRDEIRMLFSEELDFRTEARYQSLFRRVAERDRLQWVTCPALYARYSDAQVLVGEFIDAPSCAEILGVLDSAGGREVLAGMRIDPETVAERISYLALWGRYETLFFHGDPHASNLLILPDSRICLLDFGACAALSRWTNRMSLRTLACMVQNRPSEATDAILTSLSPLPNTDIDAIRRDMEGAFWIFLFNLRNPHAAWFERTSAGLWADMMAVIRTHGVPATPETLRMFRATLLYDTLSARLKPDMSLEQTARYIKSAVPRVARRLRRVHLRTRSPLSRSTAAALKLSRAISDGRIVLLRLEALYAFVLGFYHVIGVSLRMLLRLALLAAVMAGIGFLLEPWRDGADGAGGAGGADLLLWGAPAVLAVGWLLRHRLREPDPRTLVSADRAG